MALPGIGKAVRRATSGTGGSIALASALGVGIAAGRADMSTYAMDTMDEMLTGRTDTDVTFTGAEVGVLGATAFGRVPLYRPNPIKHLRGGALGAYAKAEEEIQNNNFAFMRHKYGGPIPNQGNYTRGVDGSMVFGMYNVR